MMRSHAHDARRALRGAALGTLALFAVAACDDEIPPPFEVEGTGTISGILFYDVERDGVFEPTAGDSVLAGVPVRLTTRGDTTQTISSTITDAEGRFTLAGIPIGTHDLLFDVEGLDEDIGIVCNTPRAASVRRGEITSMVVTAQESCLIPIEEAREVADDVPVTIRGVVTVGSGDLSGSYYFVQDETGGVKVLTAANAVAGQFVEVSGVKDTEFSEVVIENASLTVLGEGTQPEPIVITGEEHLSHEFQGLLVTVMGLEVTAVAVNVSGGDNVTVRAPDGSVFLIRADYDAVTPEFFTVGNVYDVTGLVSPFGGAEQLYPRSDDDIDLVP